MNDAPDPPADGVATPSALRIVAQIVLDALMLLAIIALWNTQPPPFIYVAF